jgi:Putative phage metallopeptidase
MATTYVPAPDEVEDLLHEVLLAHHPDLIAADVTFGVLMAANDEDDAITHHGYPALAVIKVTNHKDRVLGLPDCSLAIDAAWWNTASIEERKAILDHEATHLVLMLDKQGAVKTDDCNRPKLKLRPHDLELGVFLEIVDRHSKNSQEAQAYLGLVATMKQKKLKGDA